MTDVNKTIKLHSGSGAAAHGGHGHAEADEWHHHGAEEGAPQEEHLAQVNAFALIKWLVVIIAIVVVTVWGLAKLTQVVTDSIERENEIKVVNLLTDPATNSNSRAAVEAKGQAEFSKPAHVLPNGSIAIPLNDAMSKVLTKYEKGLSLEASLPPKHAAIK